MNCWTFKGKIKEFRYFWIYILSDPSIEISLFADETRIVRQVDHGEDVEALKQDLNKLYKWQDDNNMQVNGKKFEILRYGPQSPQNVGILGSRIPRKDLEFVEGLSLKGLWGNHKGSWDSLKCRWGSCKG
jgi:hypothetical protein